MNIKKDKPTDVGVVIGRFQTPYLHEAHIELIQSVINNHPKVLIFLGLSPCLVTQNNPLDFEARKQMILEKFPNVTVGYVMDTPSDEIWSKKLDEQISHLCPTQTVALYGSRDSFIGHYKGKYKTIELESKTFISASEIRNHVSKKVKATPDFRAGVIWAAYNRYPTVYTTIDAVIFKDDRKQVLLARKPNEAKYRFIGGFADPNDESFETTVRREVREEAGDIEIDNITYVGSRRVSDWRYRHEKDKIITLLFTCNYVHGRPEADDDIAEVKWFNVAEVSQEDLVEEHKKLWQMLIEKDIVPQNQKDLMRMAIQGIGIMTETDQRS